VSPTVPWRGILTSFLAVALVCLMHVLAYQGLEASPPALRAYGPAGEAWNRVGLVAAQLAAAGWLGHQALWRRRLERLESNRDPWAGLGLKSAAYACVMLAAATLGRLPESLLQEFQAVAICGAVALAVQVLDRRIADQLGWERLSA
jgi:hypothetical protein